MKPDKVLANSGLFSNPEGGDTGLGRTEHRNFLQLWFTHYMVRSGSVVAQLGKFANTATSTELSYFLKLRNYKISIESGALGEIFGNTVSVLLFELAASSLPRKRSNQAELPGHS